MKKLINKIKAKPKLYKCLKILGVVGICLSLIFNAVIIGSVIAYNSKGTSNDNEVRNVATTPIKGAFDYNGLVFFESTMALASNTPFWKEYASYLFGAENLFTTGVEQGGSGSASYTYNVPSNADFGFIGDVNTLISNGWNGWSGSNVLTISKLVFNISRNTTYNYRIIEFDVIYQGQVYPRYIYNYEYDNGDFSGYCNAGAVQTAGVYTLYNEVFVYGKYSSFYDAYGDGTKTYWNGYSKGYDVGYSIGKREGDTEGYNRGLANAPSNVFDYLAKGFNAVASIFNIQILPNLSLGILVFAPIIVSVIIVVVKMIKG